MSAPTMIDLFAGCGGMTAGFAAAGFEPVAPLEAAIDTLGREMIQPVAGQRTDQNRNQTPGQAPARTPAWSSTTPPAWSSSTPSNLSMIRSSRKGVTVTGTQPT